MDRARSNPVVVGLMFLVLVSASFLSPTEALASSSSTFNQSITGTLGVDIVDASDVTVGSPSVAFTSKSFAAIAQTSTGTLGVSAQKIRVTNPTTTATWGYLGDGRCRHLRQHHPLVRRHADYGFQRRRFGRSVDG